MNTFDIDGYKPLHWAAMRGHEAIVRYLVNEASFNRDATDYQGDTMLHLVARKGPEAMVRYLVAEAGANMDMEAKNKDGCTPLHKAACSSNEAIVRYLRLDSLGQLRGIPRVRRERIRQRKHGQVLVPGARGHDQFLPELEEGHVGGHAEPAPWCMYMHQTTEGFTDKLTTPRVLFVYLLSGRECPLQLSQRVPLCAFAKDRIRHVEVVRGRVSLRSPEPRDGGYEAGCEEGEHAGDEV
ncbi:ankyrin repeat protein, partial [Metarhizium majus ARSEF 297]